MDDIRVGRVLRAVRIRLQVTQSDLAARVGVSQSQVSLAERGRLEELTLHALRRIARGLEVDLPLSPRWRGPALDRLLDHAHAALVEAVVGELRGLGWVVVPEWSFNHYGERGSVDVLAWHPATRTLLVIEVKSRIVDVQDLLATLDRKTRVARIVAPDELGWRAAQVGRVLVLREGSTHRDAVERHQATFSAVLPWRTRSVRRWLRAPSGPCGGILFLRDSAPDDPPSGGDRVRRRTRA